MGRLSEIGRLISIPCKYVQNDTTGIQKYKDMYTQKYIECLISTRILQIYVQDDTTGMSDTSLVPVSLIV